jgi:TatD DNase family protein
VTPDLVDSHCHLDLEPLRNDVEGVLERAHAAGVAHMLCVSVNLEDFPRILEISRRHPQVFASVGVHPNEQGGREPEGAELVSHAADPRVVAIGETGLDYYRTSAQASWQQERFRRHIRAAKDCDKPLIVHMRDAEEDTVRILREEGAQAVGGVMHCFTGSWSTAAAAMDLGFCISFSGIVTFQNAAALREVARQVPGERLLIETDSPYLAPVPQRGKPNEPAFVLHVAERLAALRGQALEALAEETSGNFFRLFGSASRA